MAAHGEISLSSQLTTPVGMLAVAGTAAAVGSYVFTTRKFNELSGHIESTNKALEGLTTHIRSVDFKEIPKFKHYVQDITRNLSQVISAVQGLHSDFETVKSEHMALKAQLAEMYEHLMASRSTGEAEVRSHPMGAPPVRVPLPIPRTHPVSVHRPMTLARPIAAMVPPAPLPVETEETEFSVDDVARIASGRQPSAI